MNEDSVQFLRVTAGLMMCFFLLSAACSTAPSPPRSQPATARDTNQTSTAAAAVRTAPVIAPSPATIPRVSGDAYFEMETILGDRFVFKLVDEAKIKQARDILEKQLPKRIAGKVVVAPRAYNKPWHFHLDPASVEFSYLTDAACDGAIHYLEDHLADIGTKILPQFTWCPLSSRLVRELPPPAQPER